MAHSSIRVFLVIVAAICVTVSGNLPEGYERLTRQQKLDLLWSKAESTAYALDQLPTEIAPLQEVMQHFTNISFLQSAFSRVTDETPDRVRYVNQYGVLVKLQFHVYPNSTFTGLFSENSTILARFAIAMFLPDRAFSPCVVGKFFVDGKPSVNLYLMHTVDGSFPNRDWFSYTLRNHLYSDHFNFDPQGVVRRSFIDALHAMPGPEKPTGIDNIPVYELAAITADGDAVENVVAPFMITALPNPELRYDPNSARDFRLHLADIPVGSRVYTILARRSENAPDEAVGELVTQSTFVPSRYGDKNIFYRQPVKPWRQ